MVSINILSDLTRWFKAMIAGGICKLPTRISPLITIDNPEIRFRSEFVRTLGISRHHCTDAACKETQLVSMPWCYTLNAYVYHNRYVQGVNSLRSGPFMFWRVRSWPPTSLSQRSWSLSCGREKVTYHLKGPSVCISLSKTSPPLKPRRKHDPDHW